MLPTLCRLILSLLFIFQCSLALAEETFWLSDAPPCENHEGSHSHGGLVEVRNGIFHKHLWLRRGNSPQDQGYLSEGKHFSQLILLDTKGKISKQNITLDKEHGLLDTIFPMPDEGFYNTYVTHQQVNNGQRRFRIAKAEVLKHSCREGHDNIQSKMPPKHNAAIPLELVRERSPKENFHTRLGFGDTVSFIVMRNGKPQPDATVTLTTAKGWSKRAVSDSKGRVRYEMIRDYYPPWGMFEKRHTQPYIIKAEYSLPESGQLDGQSYDTTLYSASFAGNYYPSPRDYESYAYGLMIGLFALVFSGVAVYLYRRRRIRPYREVQFNE